ncbi:MAG: cyclic nucleotide-binding domain-containing protein [Desulfobacterales bacterium]|nr:cyclic nucleotide-binding domain-containing protein [Desulfobacterales bacterium]
MPDIGNLPELDKYLVFFEAGETVFLEGDTSQDMYFLVQGSFEIFKDDQKISVVSESGSLVGEMSFLLGEKRTATVKAGEPVKAIRIPVDTIADFMVDFPALAPQISKTLARRLQETTRVAHGLKEFCDHLPDALIMTDKDRKILAWNRAAERLHGRTWDQMEGHSLAEVYHDPEEYRQFVDDIHAGRSLTEKILTIKHPNEEARSISTSTTVLYDGHHNVNGFIFLARDVTRTKMLEQRYRRIRSWLVPLAALAVLLVVVISFSIASFSRGVRILDQRKASFRDRIIKDSRALAPVIAGLRVRGNSRAIDIVLRDYFATRNPDFFGITGLTVLDMDKKVINSFVPPGQGWQVETGHSYSGISFKGYGHSPYKLLSLFHAAADHPMGRKGVEIAYAMEWRAGGEGETGWLLFQLDMERLNNDFGVDEKILSKIKFDSAGRGG